MKKVVLLLESHVFTVKILHCLTLNCWYPASSENQQQMSTVHLAKVVLHESILLEKLTALLENQCCLRLICDFKTS